MLMIKSNKLYDALKYIAQVILPALGTLYFAIAQTWGLSHANEVVGTIVAVDAFLGVVLHLSSNAYKNTDANFDGTLDVTETEDKKSFLLNFDTDPHELDQKKTVTLRVNKISPMATKVKKKRKQANTS